FPRLSRQVAGERVEKLAAPPGFAVHVAEGEVAFHQLEDGNVGRRSHPELAVLRPTDREGGAVAGHPDHLGQRKAAVQQLAHGVEKVIDRKSTRLNSSHVKISYAVFCLKK